MPNTQFKKHLLASSVALAMASASQVQAQEGIEQDEVVVVTGIRASIQRAMDIKRDSAGVVDAISAEDIGKFPDTNLAESLQRITGIAIDRARGEGNSVTVRGFSGDFNLVTLNGRHMPNHGSDRSFDFGDLASEGVGAVEVYKTGKAFVPSGGIGATINIKTRKPFDKPGMQAVFSAKAVRDTSTEFGADYTPEYATYLSNTFMDDTIGVGLSASYQRRDLGEVSVEINGNGGWIINDGAAVASGAANNPGRPVENAPPADAALVLRPQQVSYQLRDVQRERINAQLTLQYRPTDQVTVTLDHMHAELSLDERWNSYGAWFGSANSPQGGDAYESIGDDIWMTTRVEEFSPGRVDATMSAGVEASENKISSTGLNVEWLPLDSLSFRFDYHDSSAASDPVGENGRSANMGISTFSRGDTFSRAYFDTELPLVDLNLTDSLTPDDMFITGSVFSNSWSEMEIEQFSADGTFEFELDAVDFVDNGSIDFGLGRSEVGNFGAGAAPVQRNTWGQEANQASSGAIADLLEPATVGEFFGDFGGANDPRLSQEFFIWDMNAVKERARELQALPVDHPMHLAVDPNAIFGTCGDQFCAQTEAPFGDNYIEEITSLYVQGTLSGVLLDRDWGLVAGLRHEATDVTYSAVGNDYTAVEWTGANEFVTRSEEGEEVSVEGDYTNLLPSLDLNMSITEDMVLRASASTTISRAPYGSLGGTLSAPAQLPVFVINSNWTVPGDDTGTFGDIRASGPNPSIEPFESDNFDLSYEWYYGEASYFSIGYFTKTVTGWISSVVTEDQVLDPDLRHGILGDLGQDALNDLSGGASTLGDVYSQMLTYNDPRVNGTDNVISSDNTLDGADTIILFDIARLDNSDREVDVDGIEVAIQQDFFESGFGVMANATIINSDDGEYDVTDPEDQGLVVAGISNTANFSAYYDKGGVQLRISYNWREGYPTGGGVTAAIIDDYSQIDMNASYEVTDNLTIFLEGINVTDEKYKSYVRDETFTSGMSQNKARYNLGLRLSL